MGVKKAIEDTIDYAAKFGSWVNKGEFGGRLISRKLIEGKEIDDFLAKIGHKNKKNKWYEGKIEKAKKLAEKMNFDFENVLFLGVSGSVASGHPKEDDDIDILVITKINKLWQTRLKLRWWIFRQQIPHRKYGELERKDEFCFNLWLDESGLLLPKNRQNLKNSVDLVLLKPLMNKNQTYEKFLLKNNWAGKWVPTPYVNKAKDLRFGPKSLEIKQNIFDEILNYLCFWPQYWYMKGKIKKETVGLHQAFFHR